MSASPKSSDAPFAPLASFSSLPFELRAEIVALASSYPPDLHHLDHRTCSSLRLVSRDLYSLATPVFFKHVNLYRPSQLRGFLRLLTAKPAFGRLVKSLQLGTICLLDHDWWPLMYLDDSDDSRGQMDIATSLTDTNLLPRWCCPRRRWPVHGRYDQSNPQDKAVRSALEVAYSTIGVGLGRSLHTHNGRKIGPLLWLIRVIEAQAALDLYLMEMRRLEDAAGLFIPSTDGKPFGTQGPQNIGPCIEYPSLILQMTSTAPEASAPSDRSDSQRPPFVVGRADLLAHLARVGSCTARFDHPYIFARSGLQVLDFSSARRAHGSQNLLPQMSALCYDITGSNGLSSFALPQAALLGRPAPLLPPDLTSPLDVSAHHSLTVGGLLALARSVLALTPRIENLFITGFLQAALCGSEAPTLSSLRWLCLGPLSIHSDESLPPSAGQGRFSNLEHLKLMGCGLSERKREFIATLPQLKSVEWNVKHTTEPGQTAIESFKPLIGEAYLVKEQFSAGSASRKRSRTLFESETQGSDDEEGWSTESEREKLSHSEDGDKRQPPKVLVVMNDPTHEALDPHLSDRGHWARSEDRPLCRRPHRLQLLTHVIYGDVEPRWDGVDEEMIYAWEAFNDWCEECFTGQSRWDEGDM